MLSKMNGGLSSWMLTVASGIFLAASGFTARALWDHENRLIKMEENRSAILRAMGDADKSLAVAVQHGEELNLVRSQLIQLRAELTVAIETLLKQIDTSTEDRFRKTEWIAERRAIQMELENLRLQIEQRLQNCGNNARGHL